MFCVIMGGYLVGPGPMWIVLTHLGPDVMALTVADIGVTVETNKHKT